MLNLLLFITMPLTPSGTLSCQTPSVNFIKVGRTAQIIEISLSIFAPRLCRTITPVKSFPKVGRYTLCRVPNFMKSAPELVISLGCKLNFIF